MREEDEVEGKKARGGGGKEKEEKLEEGEENLILTLRIMFLEAMLPPPQVIW